MDVSFLTGPDPKRLGVGPHVHFGDGRFDPFTSLEESVDMELIPPMSMAEHKLLEAESCLAMIPKRLDHQAGTFLWLNAYLSAVLAVLDTLVYECRHQPGFMEWWRPRRRLLWQDSTMLNVRDLRRRVVHNGVLPPILGFEVDFMEDREGRRHVQCRYVLDLDGRRHDSLPFLRRALGKVAAVVQEAKARKLIPPPPQHRTHLLSSTSWKQQQDGSWVMVEDNIKREGEPGFDLDHEFGKTWRPSSDVNSVSYTSTTTPGPILHWTPGRPTPIRSRLAYLDVQPNGACSKVVSTRLFYPVRPNEQNGPAR